jgi:hypothetical protein
MRSLTQFTIYSLAFLAVARSSLAAEQTPRDTFSDTWVATDELGRTLPGNAECGNPRQGKFVAIFYFLWLSHTPGHKVYDISQILKHPLDERPWGPEAAFHYWSQPYLGYYDSGDQFVIRRHAQMLTDAGVDVLILDVTNAITYDSKLHELCRVFADMRAHGGRTPQIAFITHSRAATVVNHLYQTFYAANQYPQLWFRWNGKPLILGPGDDLSPEVHNFFTFRDSWAWSNPDGWFGDGRDKWPWLDNYPQHYGWHDDPKTPEELSVCVAQHPVSNIGRSYHDGNEPPASEELTAQGLCFAEQWKRALEIDPQLVFVTGWNEWVAQRFLASPSSRMTLAGMPVAPGGSFFVDEYSPEYSRDIEPMKGGFGDDYYYQFVANIRRFKGVRPPPPASGPKTIHIDSGFAQWKDVAPEFLDDLFDNSHRDSTVLAATDPRPNGTGRNDFDTMKVAHDANNLYFYVRTNGRITEPAGNNWMTLFLDIDSDHKTGWEGYGFVINRSRTSGTGCTVERNAGGWKWTDAGIAQIRRSGNELMIAVSRRLLGLTAHHLTIDFKWTDNVTLDGNIMHFIDDGDVAPNGRFNYRYALIDN